MPRGLRFARAMIEIPSDVGSTALLRAGFLVACLALVGCGSGAISARHKKPTKLEESTSATRVVETLLHRQGGSATLAVPAAVQKYEELRRKLPSASQGYVLPVKPAEPTPHLGEVERHVTLTVTAPMHSK